MRIGFLFNHEAPHQASHTAPIIPELLRYPGVKITVLTSSDAQAAIVRTLLGKAGARISFVPLPVGRIARKLDFLLGAVSPIRRLAVLRDNLDRFRQLDILVVPETTSLLLRDRYGLDRLKFVWVPHGAGDRSVGFRDVVRGFDLVLVAGQKVRDRMLGMGLITPGAYAVVGYPKFDTVSPAQPLPSLFPEDRPTVLYNPHFDPRLSSWYAMGRHVIDWFAGQDRYNLIVAPHVMLFQRTIHASVEHAVVRWRRSIPDRFRHCPNIIVDTGSERSVDMTYTRAADIYLGDASSQIYEWIARPRPAVFLNPAGFAWRDDPDFAHWQLGEVVDRIGDLPGALDRQFADPDRFRAAQAAAFRSTFDQGEQSASARAASAIMASGHEWLSGR